MRPIPILLTALLSVASAIAQPPKIATVDMQELFRQYHRTDEAQKQINIERARIQQDNNERLARIRELETALGNLRKQLDDPAVADTRKQQLFKDWQIQQQEGVALDRERREFLQRRNQALNETMVQRIYLRVLRHIRRFESEHAFDAWLNCLTGCEILRFTLARVRQKRLRRRLRFAILYPAAVVFLAMSLLFQKGNPPDGRPLAVVTAPPVPSRETPASLAVLVVRDGIPTLQVLRPEALGGMEFRFSLEPITADADQFEEMELSAAWPVP